jgi:uncharacterized protein
VSSVSESGRRADAPRADLLPPEPVRWGLPDAALGLALLVAIIVGSWLLGHAPWLPHSDALGTAITAVFYAVLIAYAVGIARRRGLGRLSSDFGLELRWIDLLIGVGVAIGVRVADVIVYNFAIGALRLPIAPTGNLELPKNFVWAVIVGLGFASLVAPIVEEIYFRGLLMRAIRNFVIRRSRFQGERTTRRARGLSILISGVVFAGFHLYEATNLTMLFVLGVSILIFGLVAGVLASATKRLGPSIIMHISTNAFGAVILLSSYPR